MDEDTLIERLKQQIRVGTSPSDEYDHVRQRANSPVTMADLCEAEAKLGFALPSLLKRIYREVGNGGFGPGYGLYKLFIERSICDEDALVDTYLALHSAQHEREEDGNICYPEKVLMICEWGCNIYSFLDCASLEYRVLRKDHNYSLTDHVLESPSFHQWLEAWLNGVQLFYQCFRETWEQAPKIVF